MQADLQKIYDAQVIIYKMLDDLLRQSKGGSKIAGISTYEKDLEREIERLRNSR